MIRSEVLSALKVIGEFRGGGEGGEAVEKEREGGKAAEAKREKRRAPASRAAHNSCRWLKREA